MPLSRWSCGDLAREAVTRSLTTTISTSTVRRILAEDTLKPWQHESWIFIRDPQFAVKPLACSTYTRAGGPLSH